MLRKTVLAAALWAFGAAGAVSAADDAPPDQPSPAHSESVAQWIAGLDSGEFAVRQAASRKLKDAGLEAVLPLASAADGGRSEVTRRAVDVLDSLCESDQAAVAEAARRALERLAQSKRRLPAQRASMVLRAQRLREQTAALAEIVRLGGTVSYAAVEEGELVIESLTLGRRWAPGDDGLKHLVKLGRVEKLKLYGPRFSDEAIAYLSKLSGVQLLKLYATEISDDGQRRLQAGLPGTKIDRRHGALLGVSGAGDAKGCRLVMVRPGSAAERAGIEVDDVITDVNGESIPDLDSLIAAIAKQKPGDRVKVDLLRGRQSLEKEIVLGELGEETE